MLNQKRNLNGKPPTERRPSTSGNKNMIISSLFQLENFIFKFCLTEGYLQGDRQLRLVPVIISLCVTYVSAITMIGVGAEAYYFGVEIMFLVFSQVYK